MDEKRKKRIIGIIIYIFIGVLCFVYPMRFYLLSQYSELLQINQLFLLFLYAVIPCVLAVILRTKLGPRSLKWIALAATVLAGLCCLIHILTPEEILYGKIVLSSYSSGFRMTYANEWIFIFSQFALISSVPVLYCVAFAGDLYSFPFVRKGQSILVILAPSSMFFLSLFIRGAIINGFFETLISVFTGSMMASLILSAVYAVWALLLILISSVIYREIEKRALFENPRIKKYTPIVLTCALILTCILVGLTLFINSQKQNKFVKTYVEKYDRFEFFYKNSALVIRKEIFDEYELTEEHIQKFFDDTETVYKKLADFFPEHNLPKGVVYHAVPEKWDPKSSYAYYGDKIHLNSWADPWTNETFYEEKLFARYLSMIETAFPASVCHELGCLFITSAYERYQYYNAPYVWDSELFAVLAEYYIASEIPVVNAAGEIVTSREWEDPFYNKFFGWADKYGYKIISDTLKKVDNSSPDINNEQKHPKTLFTIFLSEKTGDTIE